jgi:hypothetical protein
MRRGTIGSFAPSKERGDFLVAQSGDPGMSALTPLLGAKQTSVPQQ